MTPLLIHELIRIGQEAFTNFNWPGTKQYTWLHYSRNLGSAFCHANAFFVPEKVGGQALGQFVSRPFKTWVNKSQKMDAHTR